MDIINDTIKQQIFFRKELRERVYWFIKLRWVAAAIGLVGLAAAHLTGLRLPLGPLVGIVLSIIGYNIVFLLIGRRLLSTRPAGVRPYHIFAHIQISLDIISLLLMIMFTGGLASPLLIFVIFHIVLAGMLLSPVSCFGYTFMVLLALGTLLLIKPEGLLHLETIHIGSHFFFHQLQHPELIISYLIFAMALVVAAYLITSVKVTLRAKGRELLIISKQLDISNTKLLALYEMIKEIGTKTRLQELMDSATHNAARIMGVKACSIKLLDKDKKYLEFASSYGLSQEFVAIDRIEVDKSTINRQIIEGSLYSIGNLDEEDYFQYPNDVRKEGVVSMLCLPLRVGHKTLGVFCVYSGESNYFSARDADFFSLMTDLIALAMEELSQSTAKTWFLNKTAHQLRSPVSAVMSMLYLLTKGYLGPLTAQQQETVTRCEKRLSILRDTINDLLKLASENDESRRQPFHPVDAAAVLQAMTPIYLTQAEQKSLIFEVRAAADLPQVLGQERLLDEIFTNLISNAIKYTPAGGRVLVSLSLESAEKIVFKVEDTGIGIPESDLNRLFAEFFRAENAKSMVEEGTGLGLAIVKEVLDQMNGTIKVASHFGRGTTVTCLIPAQRRHGLS
ncbi:MAG: GAF domain-containing protein [Deltaproteobacteria bacterium]|nr:GAF domain-containing protein [Deltaproteobacteria bacterium]